MLAATMVKEIVSDGGGGGGGSDGGAAVGVTNAANAGGSFSSSSLEVTRLASLLAERNAQVSVLTSTVEVLQATITFPSSPPRESSPGKSSGIRAPGNGGDGGGARGPKHHAAAGRSAMGGGSWVADEVEVVAPDVDGGVGILSHIGAQGLARHCVGLAVRLASTAARAGTAERRADRLAVDAEGREREVRAAEAAVARLSQRNRALEKGFRKSAAALGAVRAESATRLEEAGEEASKLR